MLFSSRNLISVNGFTNEVVQYKSVTPTVFCLNQGQILLSKSPPSFLYFSLLNSELYVYVLATWRFFKTFHVYILMRFRLLCPQQLLPSRSVIILHYLFCINNEMQNRFTRCNEFNEFTLGPLIFLYLLSDYRFLFLTSTARNAERFLYFIICKSVLCVPHKN